MLQDHSLAALTDREWQVARLVADGLTNREVGRALSLSSGTVKNHLTNVYLKLGIRRRSELAGIVVAHTLRQRFRK